MFGHIRLAYFIVGLVLTFVIGAPVEEKKDKKQLQLALPIVIGIEELLGGSLAVLGAAAGNTPTKDSHECTAYSAKKGRMAGGWCRPACFDYEISAPNGSCGAYKCCIPNN